MKSSGVSLKRLKRITLESSPVWTSNSGELYVTSMLTKKLSDRNFWPVREYVVWFANR